eukprot:2154406-Prorocentrum_lima.AAC.1
MTSSLVGSEMCIRDSLLPGVHRATSALRGSPRPRPSRRAGRRPCPAPVSYTHLTLPTICSV